jgi:hypothetical protein
MTNLSQGYRGTSHLCLDTADYLADLVEFVWHLFVAHRRQFQVEDRRNTAKGGASMSDQSSNTAQAIEQFSAATGALSFFNHFDKAMKGRQERLPPRSSGRATVEIAWLLYELMRDHFYLLRVSALKVDKISHGIRWGISEGNVTVHIAMTRSLLEHVAAMSFHTRKLSGIHDDLARRSHTLVDAIKRQHEFVKKLYYGESPKNPNARIVQFHVDDFRKALRRDYPDEATTYDRLCEFVHPNHGSNLLVSSGVLGSGVLDRPATYYINEMSIANSCILVCLQLAQKYQIEASRFLIQLDSRIEIASLPGERVTTIFSEKGLTHHGDGKSSETAILFTKARTHAEAVEMIYRFLAEKDIRTVGSKMLAAVADGFAFDVFPTTSGDVWFKTKVDWGQLSDLAELSDHHCRA